MSYLNTRAGVKKRRAIVRTNSPDGYFENWVGTITTEQKRRELEHERLREHVRLILGWLAGCGGLLLWGLALFIWGAGS